MDVSIVIPAYNAADFLAGRLRELSSFMAPSGLDYEVVVVDDGSKDATAEVIRGLGLPRIVPVLCPENRGKYAAIRSGVAVTTGRTIVMTDADLPYEFEAIPYVVELITRRHVHFAIGDRTLLGSVYAEQLGFIRRTANRLFTMFVQHIVASGIHDSQCGLKAMDGEIGRALFGILREPGFIGDVELLYIALKYNFLIRRVPVRLRYQGASTVRPVVDGIKMVMRLPRIWLRWRAGEYESPKLRELARQDYWRHKPPTPRPDASQNQQTARV